MGLLENIKEPNDIKQYDTEQWNPLAQEIRTFLLEHLSKPGGHLASWVCGTYNGTSSGVETAGG